MRYAAFVAMTTLLALGCGSANPPVAKVDPRDPPSATPKKATLKISQSTEPVKPLATTEGPPPVTASEAPRVEAPLAVSLEPEIYARKSSFLVVHLEARQLMATPFIQELDDECLRVLPHDWAVALRAWKKDVWESATIYVGPVDSDTKWRISVIAVFPNSVSRDALLRQHKSEPQSISFEGTTYQKYAQVDGPTFSHWLIGDRALYFGSEQGIRELILAKGAIQNESLARQLKEVRPKGQVTTVIDVASTREEVRKWTGASDFTKFSDTVASAALTVDFVGDTIIDVGIEANNEQEAKVWQSLLHLLRDFVANWLRGKKADLEPLAGGKRLYQKLETFAEALKNSKPKQEGARVTLKVAGPITLDDATEPK